MNRFNNEHFKIQQMALFVLIIDRKRNQVEWGWAGCGF